MNNPLTIHTAEISSAEYAQLIILAISGTLKKLFEGHNIEFRSEETTAIYYLLDLSEKLQDFLLIHYNNINPSNEI